MHSCDVAPPIQGPALLLELGTLIIAGRPPHLTPTSQWKQPATHHTSDVHSRVLAAKLHNVKSHQKTQFGFKDLEKPSRAVSPSKEKEQEQIGVRHQQVVLAGQAEALWKEHIPLCIDVLLAPHCGACLGPLMLLERWTMSIYCKGSNPPNHITSQWLLNAVRSQLHFSQISAWSAKLCEEQKLVKEESPMERQRKLSRETCNFKKYESNCDEEELFQKDENHKNELNVIYNIKTPGDNCKIVDFSSEPVKHQFPITDIGNDVFLVVLLESLPRLDEIPVMQCTCSSTHKRKTSREMVSDQVLAHSLASVCLLHENCNNCKTNSKDEEPTTSDYHKGKLKNNTFCSKFGAINPDKGCSSGISRKFSAYSIPSNIDTCYPAQTSKALNTETTDKVVPCTSASCSDNSMPFGKPECSSHSFYTDDVKVPSNKVVETTFHLVDDRMQTSCVKKGKHRCNCDDESDHGNTSRTIMSQSSLEVGVDRRTKEIAKYLRRLRKEERVRQMRESSGQSSQDNSECKSDDVVYDRVRHVSKNRLHDNKNKDKRRYKSDEDRENDSKHENILESYPTTSKMKLLTSNCKASESSSATSIPILQASRFDHAIRFGSYRNSVPFHGSLSSKDNVRPKEMACACSSIGCDQMASVRTCRQSKSVEVVDSNYSLNTDFNDKSKCRTFTTSCDFCNSDENYRPVVKKMISSFTQTDDFKCDCGNNLVTKCFDCTSSTEGEQTISFHGGMKRSWGSHNIVGIDKSALLLEAIERPSKVSEESPKEADTGIDAIIYCDSGDSVLYKDKCDNSYSDKLYSSCNSTERNSLSPCTITSGSSNSSASNVLSTDSENVSPSQQSIPPCEKTSFVKFPFADNFDKAINFIRRPRLRRFMPIVDKIDKLVMERNEERKKDNFNVMSSSNIKKFPFENQINESINFLKESFKSDSEQNDICNKIHFKSKDSMLENNNCENIVNSCIPDKHGEKHPFEESERKYKHFRSDNICNAKDVATDSLSGQLEHAPVPSVSEMDHFRWRLDSAACMVFHSRTGLPLTSSPAPLRRGKSSFDYDSTITSVSAIKSALYGESVSDVESEASNSLWSPGSSPGSPLHWESPSPPLLLDTLALVKESVEKDTFTYSATPYSSTIATPHRLLSNKRTKFRHGASSGLLGSFEESVLNGRLEPAATVAGFSAEIGASGSFCPQHLKLPVTVFFYSLGDNTTSAPYLGHINLGRRGYNVPKAGTIQVTLFNPHGTVVKMFVVMYDMADMPPNSKTFLRQKTMCVPAVCSMQPSKQDPRALRYLIHLRFLTSKSGKVYLHTDIRIIVSRKADMDTAHSLTSALNLDNKENKDRKKKAVETGTFQRRTTKGIINKSTDNNGDVTAVILKEKAIQSDMRDKLAISDEQNNNNVSYARRPRDKCLEKMIHDLNGERKDVRIRRRSDSLDGLPKELSYELRSYTYGPDNPKYSPR